MINRMRKYINFACLEDKDVIKAKISDHHPIVHDGVLFWNIMMQAKATSGAGFNNGFGIEEKEDEQYIQRLFNIANVIAEICKKDPTIEMIGLCEGPIKSIHRQQFYQALSMHDSLAKFINGFGFNTQNTESAMNWGLLMLSNKKLSAKKESYFEMSPYEKVVSDKIENRFQVWKLSGEGIEKYFALLYFPFSGDVHVADKKMMSKLGSRYCTVVENLLEMYQNKILFIAGDFNFNPIFADEKSFGNHIPPHNSILWPNHVVTVDGILLSKAERQRIIANKNQSANLYFEQGLFKRFVKKWIDKNRYVNGELQKIFDNARGLIPYPQRG